MTTNRPNNSQLNTTRMSRDGHFRQFFQSRLGVIGSIILGVVLVCALFPVGLLPHDPFSGTQSDRFLPPGEGNVLGTEALGRDIFSMMVAGARYTLIVAVGATIISVGIGLGMGLSAGYFRRRTDAFIMRLVDIQLAFPDLVLVIAVIAIFGPGLWNLVIILGIAGWAPYARLTRSAVLAIRERGFIRAGESLGVTAFYNIRRHILPNIRGTIIVYMTSDLARIILLESALSFLGLGVQPPTPSWGAMIADGRQYIFDAWWVSTIPGIAIVLTVLAINFIGDEVRDVLDPRSTRDNLGLKLRRVRG